MRNFFNILFLVLLTSYSWGQSNENVNLLSDFYTAILNNDKQKIQNLAPKLKPKISKNKLNYYRTLLKQVKNNSVLVTNSLDDTYSVIILQYTEGLKKSVNVISLKLLNQPKYFEEKFTALKLSADFDKTSTNTYLTRILKNTHIKVYVSTTVNQTMSNYLAKSFYLMGLVSSKSSYLQFSTLNEFYNDYLKLKPVNLNNQDKDLYVNYLPPLLLLYKLKKQSNNNTKKLKKVIVELSKQLGKQKVVNKILAKYDEL